MRTLYESILDDEDEVIGSATTKITELAKLNKVLDGIHEDVLKFMKTWMAPGALDTMRTVDGNFIFKDRFENFIIDGIPRPGYVRKCEKVFKEICDKYNRQLKGELWSSARVGLFTIYYIPEDGVRKLHEDQRDMVYRLAIRKNPLDSAKNTTYFAKRVY